MHPVPPPKKEVALALLERSSVHVHLDPRKEGVLVPAWLRKRPQLLLHIGLNMPVPIPDLALDDSEMRCTLSFDRSPFLCVIPWSSVYAMVGDDGRGMVWPEDIPPELAEPGESRRGDAGRPRKLGRRSGDEEVSPAEAPVEGQATPDVTNEDDAGEGKPKKAGRKKPRVVPNPDEGRARLVALPMPAVADPHPSRRAKDDKKRQQSPRDAPGAAPPRAPTARGGAKSKRELPPYLRVVK